jgi:hypothetical protein
MSAIEYRRCFGSRISGFRYSVDLVLSRLSKSRRDMLNSGFNRINYCGTFDLGFEFWLKRWQGMGTLRIQAGSELKYDGQNRRK